jgi:hypothetical protein
MGWGWWWLAGGWWLALFYPPTTVTNVTSPSIDGSSTPTQAIQLADNRSVTESVLSFFLSPIKKLNPYNWFLASNEANAQFERFMEKQNEMITQNNRFYPFTEINPHASWWNRMRIYYFGETIAENSERISLRSYAWREMRPMGLKKAQSIVSSPATSFAGLTPRLPNASIDFAGVANWYQETLNKVTTAPNTPNLTPLNLNNPFNSNSLGEALNRLTTSYNPLDSVTDNITASPPIDSSILDASLQERVSNLVDSTSKPSYASIVSNNIETSPLISHSRLTSLEEGWIPSIEGKHK